MFFSGQRPAVNVGLSVSRVGGDAQTKAMKKASGAIRLDLAQYREMKVFTQFAGDLDDETRNQLVYGQGLMQMLRQEQYSPYTMSEQVVILVIMLAHVLRAVEPGDIKSVIAKLLQYFKDKRADILEKIEKSGQLGDDDKAEILKTAEKFIEGR